jgi:uncharacterized beta-barrel protein YwiB (DUF1934 family)
MSGLAEGRTTGIQTAAGELQSRSNKNYIRYYEVFEVNLSEREVDEISTNHTLRGIIIRHKDYVLLNSYFKFTLVIHPF